jgi:hypothetical protein
LRERLAEIAARKRSLTEKLEALTANEKAVQELLRSEEDRWATSQPSLFGNGGRPSRGRRREPTRLADFLRETMADGAVWKLEQIKEAAKSQHIDFGKKDPGRVLHFALVGLKNAKQAEMVGKGQWRLARDNDRDGVLGERDPETPSLQ